ncbi:MAG: NADH:ubiquinone oxidoreductase subunit N, partial [Burkholderiales bacterium]
MTILSHLRALPEMVLLVGACVAMIADLYSKDERRRIGYNIALVTLLLCFVLTVYIILESGGTGRYLFNGLFVSDLMSHLLKLACYVATWAALVYSRQWLLERSLLRGEFITLLLFSLLGMMVLISASSFLTVYL